MTGIDENITEEDFASVSYTNPDSLEAHERATNREEDGQSQARLNDQLKPRTTVSPDNNYTVYLNVRSVGAEMGIEEYVLNDTRINRVTRLPDVNTIGYYAVAFSPDSKMYAAPKIISCNNGSNCQYAIDISSAETNELLHRELIPFYKENTKYTPMEWDRSAVYGIYWSQDGSAIIYEVLGADVDGGRYPTTLVMNRLNVNYTELRALNGYVEPVAETNETNATVNGSGEQIMSAMQDEPEEENSSAEDTEPVRAPGFSVLTGVAALVVLLAGRRLTGRFR